MHKALASYIPLKALSALDRLDSWKMIAAYLGREVRTAQRWEKKEGLPVRRHFHAKSSSVYALKHEIDTWLLNRRPVADFQDRSDQPVLRVQPITRAVPMRHLPLRLQVHPIGEESSCVHSGHGRGASPGSLELCIGAHRIRLSVSVETHANGNARRHR
jgi:hypothetical protein